MEVRRRQHIVIDARGAAGNALSSRASDMMWTGYGRPGFDGGSSG